MTQAHAPIGYGLLDSGDGEKLEQLGNMLIARPSSLSIWKKRHPDLWPDADATFEPGKGWTKRKGASDEWAAEIGGMRLVLRLQTNGQIGFFPEHLSYLSAFGKRTGAKALNLFGFTGMATVYLLQRGWHVCHVDISKKAVEWANRNIEANDLPREGVQMICEDALRYLSREVKRGKRYDLVIADPPSFSRLTKDSTWNLEDVAKELVESSLALLPDGKGEIVLTSHHPAIGGRTFANLVLDASKSPPSRLEIADLEVPETNGSRKLPCGSYMMASFG